MEETKKYCPCCGKHCDLSAPRCHRGEEYARTGEMGNSEENQARGHHDHHGHHHGPEGHGKHGHPHGEGSHPRSRHKNPMEGSRYKSLETEEKLTILLQALEHMGRLGNDGRGSQGRILGILAREGTMTQRALTEQLGIQPGSASEIIGKLERAGLLSRSPSSLDRRTADITLTGAGRARVAEYQPPESMFSVLSSQEKETLLGLLEKLNMPREGREDRP